MGAAAVVHPNTFLNAFRGRGGRFKYVTILMEI